MKEWHDLKDMLCKELEEYARKGKMSAGDLETIHKLTDTIKNLDKIKMLEEEDGRSRADGRMMGGGRGGTYRGNSYDDGESRRRQRRDDRGRYSRDGGNYSYDDGMEEVWEILSVMENGLPEEQRDAIRRFRREMQR